MNRLLLLTVLALVACAPPLHGSGEADYLAKYGRPAYGFDYCFKSYADVPVYAPWDKENAEQKSFSMINIACPNRGAVRDAIENGLKRRGLPPSVLGGVVIITVPFDTRLACGDVQDAEACAVGSTVYFHAAGYAALQEAVSLLPAAKLLGAQAVPRDFKAQEQKRLNSYMSLPGW